MTTTQRFGTPSLQHGDLTGRMHQANAAVEKDNEAARNLAVGRIKENQSLRYVSVPGSSAPWPVPKDLYEILPPELRGEKQ